MVMAMPSVRRPLWRVPFLRPFPQSFSRRGIPAVYMSDTPKGTSHLPRRYFVLRSPQCLLPYFMLNTKKPHRMPARYPSIVPNFEYIRGTSPYTHSSPRLIQSASSHSPCFSRHCCTFHRCLGTSNVVHLTGSVDVHPIISLPRVSPTRSSSTSV